MTADAGPYDCVVSNSAGQRDESCRDVVREQGGGRGRASGLTVVYDGAPHAAIVSTVPAGLGSIVTYNGALDAADLSWRVCRRRHDRRSELRRRRDRTLAISTAVIVRHAPSLNGRLDGSIQLLLPESTVLNSSARVSGDLLVPGTPIVRLNGQPVFGGTLDGVGSASPATYTITINSNATLAARRSPRRCGPMPVVAARRRRPARATSPSTGPGQIPALRHDPQPDAQ